MSADNRDCPFPDQVMTSFHGPSITRTHILYATEVAACFNTLGICYHRVESSMASIFIVWEAEVELEDLTLLFADQIMPHWSDGTDAQLTLRNTVRCPPDYVPNSHNFSYLTSPIRGPKLSQFSE
jgi:hypothetical protein